jgi:hypothetical protein
VAWLKAQGYAPCKASLKDLELAANCTKHGPGRSCAELFNRRPDLFDRDEADAFPPFKPSDHNLKIDGAALQGFFDVVRRSGPKGRRP